MAWFKAFYLLDSYPRHEFYAGIYIKYLLAVTHSHFPKHFRARGPCDLHARAGRFGRWQIEGGGCPEMAVGACRCELELVDATWRSS